MYKIFSGILLKNCKNRQALEALPPQPLAFDCLGLSSDSLDHQPLTANLRYVLTT